ncbi:MULTISPECIES: phage holin family protein [unclassified Streptomyces]|uniref:phage holin family protein n=1 Tax=unclassified Streptomyces TaxID=2593676 RepID=UPI002DDAB12D|nr:phage holin family protein [Streptomyces sp. NBC_00243]WRZ23973.1 phage holin family protein [Streptomyces sp. NBC_00243]
MTSGQKAVAAFLGLIYALLVVILGLCMSWSVWLWLGAIGVFAAVWAIAVLAVTRARKRDPFPPGTLLEQPAPPPVERRELTVSRVPLPSDLADYDFLFSARVRWCPVDLPSSDQPINFGALAVESVLARARQVTEVLKPFRSSLVQHELNSLLGVMEEDREGYVRAMALDVQLTLSEADQERLNQLAAIRKDEAVWEHQRKYEQNKREYLGGDVLTSTGSAVVWWLAKNDDHIEKTVKDLGLLARLTSAANDRDVDEQFRYLVPEAFPPPPDTGRPDPSLEQELPLFERHAPDPADLFTDFFRQMGFRPGEEEGALIADQVAMAITSRDAVTAEEIRRRFCGQPVGPHTNGAKPGAAETDSTEGGYDGA